MDHTRPQNALREWRNGITHPATVGIATAIGVVLGLAGPFGTDTLLPLVPRTAYWLITVFATYSAGLLAEALARPVVASRPAWQRILAQGLLTGVFVSIVVLVINRVILGWGPSGSEAPGFVTTLFAISIAVTAAIDIAARHAAPASHRGPDSPAAPAILERLPLDKRGTLVALSVEDHYVRVRTTRGEALVLMRLSDAMREVGDTPGAQVHRSHWVAFGQVRAARRRGDRAVLTLTTGPDLPVSRANVPRIREAGLLPR